MAFDQSTRNRLQRFVTDARLTLEEEFTRQLQNDYGLDPISGTASPLESLRHINDQQRETARILRETLAHYCASADTDTKAGLDRIVREQAFTVLNRLAALRMAEARGLLMESVGSAYQAKGFQLYLRLAGTGLGETGDAYRVYLQSVFDELSQDLPGLFDRFSPKGRLFPREAALIQVLTLINHGEIEPLWAEDETIGWIYQYFNSKEERKRMRDASQAPRNSRELAVRNQFFTPRYVVEFLVDNTLGRLWFNWTGGQTGLRDRCQYLLVKPDEQLEPAKRLRDPRTIKLLDPACGSMHFGLYAFDLFLEIYREAWAWEQTHGPGCLDIETGANGDLKPLIQTYPDQDAFLHDVPRLIIEHNIYGVDIDPRAAQIASLALWLRAQRAWHEAGVKAKDRAQVGHGHVVAAVAPPAEVDLRKRFMEGLDPLDAHLFEQTLFMLKGLPELGVLLQVEKELPALVRRVFGEHGPMFATEDMAQWQKAEERLREALTDYARAARSTYQGRLFAEDALQGLRLVDIVRLKFDAIVMNPPFGLIPEVSFQYTRENYPNSYVEVLAAFLERARQLSSGYVGAITSRAFMVATRLSNFRDQTLIGRLHVIADLGEQIMDDAFVEAAAFVISDGAPEKLMVLDARKHDRKKETLKSENFLKSSDLFTFDQSKFRIFPKNRIIYFGGEAVSRIMDVPTKFEPTVGTARQGLATWDDFRFVRVFWEVETSRIGKGGDWEFLAKGGAYSRYKPNTHLLMKWRKNGAESRAINIAKNGTDAQAKQASDYWRLPGATYSMRSQKGFSARLLPAGCLFTGQGPLVCSTSDVKNDYILGWLNSDLIRTLVEMQSNDGKFMSGIIKTIPWIYPDKDVTYLEQAAAKTCALWINHLSRFDLCSPYFRGIPSATSLSELKHTLSSSIDLAKTSQLECDGMWNGYVNSLYGASQSDTERVRQRLFEEKVSDGEDPVVDTDGDEPDLDEAIIADEKSLIVLLVNYVVGGAFGRWAVADESPDAWPDSHYSPIPQIQPAQLASTGCRPILVNDANSDLDIVELALNFCEVNVGIKSDNLEGEISRQFSARSLREFLASDARFFASHLAMFSQSRRKAPIYWPISTSSGSYTLWLYYPSLTDQTLFTAVNDFIEPKLKQVGQDVAALRTKGSARSRDDEKSFEVLQTLELELIELRGTLLAVAQTYCPNHDDGVQITAAPLWQLFRHKPWQKILKDTWAKLEKGDYDWAHLAMAYWPDRVREKCETDKSLAIAHDLEHLYVEPEPKPTKARGRKKNG